MSQNEHVLEHEVDPGSGVHILRIQSAHLQNRLPLVVLEEAVDAVLEQEDHPRVVINMECVEFLATTALAKLISCNEKIVGKDGRTSLCCVHPNVAEVLEITRFDELFNIYDSEEAAVESM